MSLRYLCVCLSDGLKVSGLTLMLRNSVIIMSQLDTMFYIVSLIWETALDFGRCQKICIPLRLLDWQKNGAFRKGCCGLWNWTVRLAGRKKRISCQLTFPVLRNGVRMNCLLYADWFCCFQERFIDFYLLISTFLSWKAKKIYKNKERPKAFRNCNLGQ